MNITGLDAAVQDKNIGCVLGEYSNGINNKRKVEQKKWGIREEGWIWVKK